jgi:hypothetical protein
MGIGLKWKMGPTGKRDVSGVAGEEPQDDDDRNGNADKPKKS